jgi:PIN domain nuclease of toxin-antitoxin system
VIVYLDTNAVVYLAQRGIARFHPRARRLVEHGGLRISPMVLLELEYMSEVGRSALRGQDVLRKLEQELGVSVCDLSFAEVARAAVDEKWTRDPFDRIIAAQARLNGLAPLISSDEEMLEHYPRTVW